MYFGVLNVTEFLWPTKKAHPPASAGE